MMTVTLPAIGEPESNRQDYKLKYPDDDSRQLKMMSDVVAFANANGGKLYIGIVDKDDRVAAIPGLLPSEAKKTRTDIERWVKDLTQPIPVINCSEVSLENGNIVVVVNVQAYPGVPVGFRLAGGAEGPWSFPVRVATQTKLYPPERLVFLMDVDLRRKIQLLYLVMADEIAKIHHTEHHYQINGLERMKVAEVMTSARFSVVAVDETGSFTLRLTNGQQTADAWIPIDTVKTIWRVENGWCLWLTGQIKAPVEREKQRLLYALHPGAL